MFIFWIHLFYIWSAIADWISFNDNSLHCTSSLHLALKSINQPKLESLFYLKMHFYHLSLFPSSDLAEWEVRIVLMSWRPIFKNSWLLESRQLHMICQLCTILTSTQLEHKFCAAAIGERPYSALASSDAEIGAGRAYAVPAGGYFAQNHYTGTHREYLHTSGYFAQTFYVSTHRVLCWYPLCSYSRGVPAEATNTVPTDL